MMSDQGWSYQDTLSFEFQVKDTTSRYDLLLNINHDTEYAYENCYARISTTFPDGSSIQDLVSFEFTDNLDQWQGKCGTKRCEVQILLQENIYFKQPGLHKIAIEQYNRQEKLQGINSFEFKIIDAKAN